MTTTLPAGASSNSSCGCGANGSERTSCGSCFQFCEPGTTRVAPLSEVKSSSSQIVLHTQYPRSSGSAAASQCSGCGSLECGSAERALKLLSLKSFPST